MNQILLVKELNFVKGIKLSVWSDKTQMELFCVFFFILVLKLVYSTMVLEYTASPRQVYFLGANLVLVFSFLCLISVTPLCSSTFQLSILTFLPADNPHLRMRVINVALPLALPVQHSNPVIWQIFFCHIFAHFPQLTHLTQYLLTQLVVKNDVLLSIRARQGAPKRSNKQKRKPKSQHG